MKMRISPCNKLGSFPPCLSKRTLPSRLIYPFPQTVPSSQHSRAWPCLHKSYLVIFHPNEGPIPSGSLPSPLEASRVKILNPTKPKEIIPLSIYYPFFILYRAVNRKQPRSGVKNQNSTHVKLSLTKKNAPPHHPLPVTTYPHNKLKPHQPAFTHLTIGSSLFRAIT